MAGFFYTHPWTVLVLALHGLWIALWRRARLAAFLLSALAAALIFLPWFLYSGARMLAQPRFHFPHEALWLELLRTGLTWTGHPERRGIWRPGLWFQRPATPRSSAWESGGCGRRGGGTPNGPWPR
jgi:hypothetical protein